DARAAKVGRMKLLIEDPRLLRRPRILAHDHADQEAGMEERDIALRMLDPEILERLDGGVREPDRLRLAEAQDRERAAGTEIPKVVAEGVQRVEMVLAERERTGRHQVLRVDPAHLDEVVLPLAAVHETAAVLLVHVHPRVVPDAADPGAQRSAY